MSIVNRRNALVGWLTIKVGKTVVRKQAPSARTGGATAGALAALAGAALFWRKRSAGGSEE